jgi:hypothetical protein
MAPLRHATERLSAWLAVEPPETFTYRSYLRYLFRALPRYGLGPTLIVAYRIATHGATRAAIYAAWAVSAVTMSLVGFALARRDGGPAAVAGTVAAAACAFLYVWLPLAGLGRWLVVFVAWFGVIAAGIGAAAATR